MDYEVTVADEIFFCRPGPVAKKSHVGLGGEIRVAGFGVIHRGVFVIHRGIYGLWITVRSVYLCGFGGGPVATFEENKNIWKMGLQNRLYVL